MDYRIISLLSAIVTELTFFYNSFMFFSFSQKDTLMWIDYIPWILGVLFILIFNKKFLQKPRTVLSLFLINGAFVLLWIILGFKYFIHASGFGAYTYAILFLLITASRGVYLTIKGISETNMLMHTEFSVMSAGFFFFTQVGPFQIPMEFNLPSLFMVVLNVIALIRMRIYGSASKSIASSKWKGILFLSSLTSFFASIITAVLLLLSAPFRTFFLKLIAFLKFIIVWFFTRVGQLLKWLFSMFKSDGEMILPEQKELKIPNESEMELFSINTDLLIIAAILIAVVIIILLLIMFRKSRLKVLIRTQYVNRYQQKDSFRFFSFLRSLLKRIYYNMKFAITLMFLRNTPGAAFIIIEKICKKKGLPKKVHETPCMYLNRLSRCMKWESQYGFDQNNALLLKFIDDIESYLYGNSLHDHTSRMTKEDIKKLISVFSQGKIVRESK